ncbi:MAG: ATPase, T2SS/T4P/T4SS family [Thermofilum sp.]
MRLRTGELGQGEVARKKSPLLKLKLLGSNFLRIPHFSETARASSQPCEPAYPLCREERKIIVYACRDRGSLEMIEALRRILASLPREERPKVKLRVLKLREPSQLQTYIEQLGELFGGVYLRDLRKHGIRALPAIVVDGEKVLEGRYPSEDELRALLAPAPRQAPELPPEQRAEQAPSGGEAAPQHGRYFLLPLATPEGATPAQGLCSPSSPILHQQRLPKIRVRDKDRLEGAEVPLPPLAHGRVVRTPSGTIFIGDGAVRVYAEREGEWGPLQPLAEYPGTQEVFIRELDGEVYITAGIEGRRYVVELPRQLLVERLAQRIAIEAGIPLSERNPQDSGEFKGWRVNLALPQLAGGWQLSAARVVKVEPFKAEPLLLARLVALAASPNSITFVGPPGSGKTTALIGVLSAIVKLWPKLRVSIVEEEPEVATQVRGPNVVTYFSFGDRSVTANIRATRRYDRPDLLVVGELRGEEVPSWFEAAGSGIPVLTTAHSSGFRDALKRLDTLIQAAGLRASVLDVVRVWVVCGKVVSSEGGVQRGVQAVYVTTPEGLQPIFKAGRHLPEREFLMLLPPELQLGLEGACGGEGESNAEKVYERLKQVFGPPSPAIFEKMEPLPLSLVEYGEEKWV